MSLINTTLAQIQELELSTILPILILACLGLLLIMLASARLIRGKIMVASVHGISGILLLSTGILLLTVALNIHTYQRLTYEQEIARLTFQQLAPQKYNVSIIYNTKDDKQEFLLEGDEWQMDARILRWSPSAQLLGLNAQHRLERISGRYQDLHLDGYPGLMHIMAVQFICQ
jgi:glucan phosphoethanolaminetransferase (alkaline phosphatase superfamily)